MSAEEDEPGERSVADPEEFNQTERLRTINQVRKQAGEAVQVTMTQLRTEEGFELSDRQQVLRAAMYRYLTEIEWLAHQAEDAALLKKESLGTVELQPPEYLKELVNGRTEGYPRVIGDQSVEAREWSIQGINGYLTAPEIFRHTWTVQVDTRHEGSKPLQESVATYMPVHISLNAYRLSNRFLAKNGIDVELEESEHRDVVDKDLLEEVEQWRRETLA